MVEPPSTIAPARMSATAARAMPSMSTPPCSKKRRSSIGDRGLAHPEGHLIGLDRLPVALGGNRSEERAVGCVQERVLRRSGPSGASRGRTRTRTRRPQRRRRSQPRRSQGRSRRPRPSGAALASAPAQRPLVPAAGTQRLGIERSSPAARRAHGEMLAMLRGSFAGGSARSSWWNPGVSEPAAASAPPRAPRRVARFRPRPDRAQLRREVRGRGHDRRRHRLPVDLVDRRSSCSSASCSASCS